MGKLLKLPPQTPANFSEACGGHCFSLTAKILQVSSKSCICRSILHLGGRGSVLLPRPLRSATLSWAWLPKFCRTSGVRQNLSSTGVNYVKRSAPPSSRSPKVPRNSPRARLLRTGFFSLPILKKKEES